MQASKALIAAFFLIGCGLSACSDGDPSAQSADTEETVSWHVAGMIKTASGAT